MTGMLTERPGDRSRLRADCKRQIKLYVNAQRFDVEFTAKDCATSAEIAISTVYTLLAALERKGVLTSRIKPNDTRRYYKRVPGRDVR